MFGEAVLRRSSRDQDVRMWTCIRTYMNGRRLSNQGEREGESKEVESGMALAFGKKPWSQ